ncbi:MAG: AzlC family ABC transporter permease [Spirochaetaceae bacterium]|jgi:4-azaleucine resistance transporter AzlC|nr:AzlC family ABC transporter permease [Spirochaetaceae bacterium]
MKLKNHHTAGSAFKYSIPVLMGYLAIGVAFGLLLQQAGYPWYLALFMSIVMYAGSAQYIAVGLFASGASLASALLIQLVVNARHIAYGITMLGRYKSSGGVSVLRKIYTIFALTDETFALLSSWEAPKDWTEDEQSRFMFYVSLLDHSYWTAGSVIGAVCGSLIPFKIEGIGFALTALFIVLMIEQIYRIKKALPFIAAACAALLCAALLPVKVSLLSALVLSLAVVQLLPGHNGAANAAIDGAESGAKEGGGA